MLFIYCMYHSATSPKTPLGWPDHSVHRKFRSFENGLTDHKKCRPYNSTERASYHNAFQRGRSVHVSAAAIYARGVILPSLKTIKPISEELNRDDTVDTHATHRFLEINQPNNKHEKKNANFCENIASALYVLVRESFPTLSAYFDTNHMNNNNCCHCLSKMPTSINKVINNLDEIHHFHCVQGRHCKYLYQQVHEKNDKSVMLAWLIMWRQLPCYIRCNQKQLYPGLH